ncbi:TOBE domain-containing protein [Ornithinimicrobium cryptoxanthini]|uniref:Helix-turn-helix transcriptional regulator n=1 Tax=Ornithinimicrobium cryptoxanthini TaxID=2934161 RepID=A0ABY4YKW0_9MICO|nr:helix-turn-helix transcriptional regulator [Ornithinimicrobium cryptoxanthini]USQ76895.1 helix-turn-helix transcriptional regulator [Ornithinimicrobium cryptoxanthini]
MPQLRISEAAALLGVSDDTVRRWADQGRLQVERSETGRMQVEGRDLAALAQELAADQGSGLHTSARNQLRGIVTKVTRDVVMAQVELQCGPFRVVSLMSAEAVDELGLEPGVVAIASIKATQVVVAIPAES